MRTDYTRRVFATYASHLNVISWYPKRVSARTDGISIHVDVNEWVPTISKKEHGINKAAYILGLYVCHDLGEWNMMLEPMRADTIFQIGHEEIDTIPAARRNL